MKNLTLAISLALFMGSAAFADGLSNATLGSNPGLSYTTGTHSMTIDCPNKINNINWTKLNVNSNETLNFNLPNANSNVFNRVTGGSVSTIAGKINAIGSGADSSYIVLSNNAGVTFAKGAILNVGQFSALSDGGNVNIDSLTVEKGSFSAMAPNGNVNVTGNNYFGKDFFIYGDKINDANKISFNNAVVKVPNGSFHVGRAAIIDVNNSQITAKNNSTFLSKDNFNLANSSVKLSNGTIKLVTTTANMKNSQIAIGDDSAMRNAHLTNTKLTADDTTFHQDLIIGNGSNDNSQVIITNSRTKNIALKSSGNSINISNSSISGQLKANNGGNVTIADCNGKIIKKIEQTGGVSNISNSNINSLTLKDTAFYSSNVKLPAYANIQLSNDLIGKTIAIETVNGTITKSNLTAADLIVLNNEINALTGTKKINKLNVSILENTSNSSLSSEINNLTNASSNAYAIVDTLKVNNNNYRLASKESKSMNNQFAKNVKSLAIDNDNENKKKAKLKKLNNGFRIEEKIIPIEK